jgi:WD40 repeat protein
MDVKTCVSRNGTTSTPSLSSQPSDILIATGSKDKTIIVRSFDESFIGSSSSTPFTTLWRSSFHTAKVGCVQFNPSTGSSLLASASDDGIVAVHDYRSNGSGTSGNVQATIDYYLVHGGRPHSVVWHPKVDHVLATAGLDKAILLWDLRNVSHPLTRLDGHVPISTTRCKKIHRPTIWSSDLDHNKNNNCGNVKHWGNHDDDYWSAFVLTGGEGSGSMSMYEINRSTTARSGGTIVPEEATASLSMTCPGPSPTAGVFSQLLCRGRLPSDCGDAGCIAVRRQSHNHHHYRNNNHHHQDISMAVSVDDGEVLVLTSKLQLP